jgi:hypothetical protein
LSFTTGALTYVATLVPTNGGATITGGAFVPPVSLNAFTDYNVSIPALAPNTTYNVKVSDREADCGGYTLSVGSFTTS